MEARSHRRGDAGVSEPAFNSAGEPVRVLAIGAHPDDVELGSLGYLLQAAGAGAWIGILVLSDGRCGGDARVRRREAEDVAAALPAELFWAGLPDTRIALRGAIRVVGDTIADFDPNWILVHDPSDTHQDHRVTAKAVISAARHVPNLLFYEGPSSRRFRPTAYVDIRPVVRRKIELIRCHRSQICRCRLDRWARITALYRAQETRVPGRYAEAFRPLRQLLVPSGTGQTAHRWLVRSRSGTATESAFVLH
jgi:LmbE family N-acetylglucosaminyl deacetylase